MIVFIGMLFGHKNITQSKKEKVFIEYVRLFWYIIVIPKVANKLRYQNTSEEKRQMHKHYENEFKRKIVQLHI